MKTGHNTLKIFSWLFLVVLSFSLLVGGLWLKKDLVRKVEAFSCGAFNPPSPQDVAALQAKINAAKDGDVINLPVGTYSGPVFTPIGLGDAIFVSAARGGSSTCLIRIDGKKITLKGAGANQTIFYGEGHAPIGADKEPYKSRGGICILNNSYVTLDSVRVKEFQKRGVVVYNSSVIVKNSIIEGHDEGGVSLLGDSSGLFVNNFFQFMNFGGIMLWQNSRAKIVNNILNGANVAFFYHPGTPDTAAAEVVNNIFSSGSKINQVDWWTSEAGKLQSGVKASHNLFDPDAAKCNPPLEYCTNFPGKLTGDPLFTEPVGDMCGIAPWANYTLKEGSPAIGSGDPSVPGTKTLGNAGGPCVDGNSSMCTSYIAANMPKPPVPPSPTPQPTSVPVPTSPPALTSAPLPTGGGQQSSYSNIPIGTQTGGGNVFVVENIGFGTLTIQGIRFGSGYVVIKQKVDTGNALEYSLGSVCQSGDMPTGVLYEDEAGKASYVELTVHCGKTNVFDIY